jgi:hypothetical protein
VVFLHGINVAGETNGVTLPSFVIAAAAAIQNGMCGCWSSGSATTALDHRCCGDDSRGGRQSQLNQHSPSFPMSLPLQRQSRMKCSNVDLLDLRLISRQPLETQSILRGLDPLCP